MQQTIIQINKYTYKQISRIGFSILSLLLVGAVTLSSCSSRENEIAEGPINASVEVITKSREFVEYAQVMDQLRAANNVAFQDVAPLDMTLLTNTYNSPYV